MGTCQSRTPSQLVHVCMDAGHRGLLPPRIAPGDGSPLVPGRRLLPLDFGREPQSVAADEGVGLEPGDVDDGSVKVKRGDSSEPPLAGVIRRPGPRSCDVVLLL